MPKIRKLLIIYQKQISNYDLDSEFAFQCCWGGTRFEKAVSLQIMQTVKVQKIKFVKQGPTKWLINTTKSGKN